MRNSFKYSLLSVLVAFTLLVGPTHYALACCGIQPVVTDLTPVAGQSFVPGDTVCFTGKITGTRVLIATSGPTPEDPVSMELEIMTPSGVTIECTPMILSNYVQISETVATWDFSCCFVPTECGTYTYAKTAWWSRAGITLQSQTVGGRFTVRCVPVDIKPQSCPNPLNFGDRGVLPVAILGTANFDVTQVDVTTVQLAGIAPLSSALEDVATPSVPIIGKRDCNLDCTTAGADGFVDLTLKFSAPQIALNIEPVSDGDCVVLNLTGSLLDGTPFRGEDVVRIKK